MFEPNQRVKVNLSGLTIKGVAFSQNVQEALGTIMQRVSAEPPTYLVEAEGHHPALLTEWGRVTVTWWTHKIRGLHRNDFIMAAKTDVLAAETGHQV